MKKITRFLGFSIVVAVMATLVLSFLPELPMFPMHIEVSADAPPSVATNITPNPSTHFDMLSDYSYNSTLTLQEMYAKARAGECEGCQTPGSCTGDICCCGLTSSWSASGFSVGYFWVGSNWYTNEVEILRTVWRFYVDVPAKSITSAKLIFQMAQIPCPFPCYATIHNADFDVQLRYLGNEYFEWDRDTFEAAIGGNLLQEWYAGNLTESWQSFEVDVSSNVTTNEQWYTFSMVDENDVDNYWPYPSPGHDSNWNSWESINLGSLSGGCVFLEVTYVPYFWPGDFTQVVWFQPNYIIQGTELPNRAGDVDGEIHWGSNPAGIDISLGELIPEEEYNFEPIIPSGQDIIKPEPEVMIGDVDLERLHDNPLYPLVQVLTIPGFLTERLVWLGLAWFIVIAAMFGVHLGFDTHKDTEKPQHFILTTITGLGLSILFWTMGIFTFWVIILMAFGLIGAIIWERQPVL